VDITHPHDNNVDTASMYNEYYEYGLEIHGQN
jgi:hypothetical protein